MITVEGGVVIKPSNSIPKLILAINDDGFPKPHGESNEFAVFNLPFKNQI